MKRSAVIAEAVVPNPITRPFAERINAIEGLTLRADLAELLARLKHEDVPMEERRERVLEALRSKRR